MKKYCYIILCTSLLMSCYSSKVSKTFRYNGIYKTSEAGINYVFYNDSLSSIKIDTIPVLLSLELTEQGII